MPNMQNPSNWLVSKPKFLAPTVVLLGLPIAYIIKKHMDWESKPDSKQRMLIHHLTFWPLFFLGIGLGHNARHSYRQAPLKASGWIAAGMTTMIAGFEGGDRLARYWVPKKPKPQQTLALSGQTMSGYSRSLNSQPFPISPQSQSRYYQTRPVATSSLLANPYPSPSTSTLFNRMY